MVRKVSPAKHQGLGTLLLRHLNRTVALKDTFMKDPKNSHGLVFSRIPLLPEAIQYCYEDVA